MLTAKIDYINGTDGYLRVIISFLVILFNMVFQSTVFNHIAILDVKPLTSIAFIVSYAMLRGDVEGALFGFCAGLMQDAFFSNFLGLHACLGMLIGFLCGKPFKDFYRENILLVLFLSIVSVLTYEFFFYVFSFLFRGQTELFFYFRKIILPETVYTSLVAMIIYRLVYGINNWLEAYEKNRRRMFD